MKERPTAAQEARRPKRSGVPPLRYELAGHQQLLERTKKQLLNGEDVALDFKPEPTQVEELADPDAMALFRRLAPAFIAERQDATERCVKLAGGLPLAIVLIARHLNRSAKGPRHRLEEALADVLNAES